MPAALPMAPGVGAHRRLRPRAGSARVLRSDSHESPAQLLICVNQTTFKGAFVRSLERQARAGARALLPAAPLRAGSGSPRCSSGGRACGLRERWEVAALFLPALSRWMLGV